MDRPYGVTNQQWAINACQQCDHTVNDGQTSSPGHLQTTFTKPFPRNQTVPG